MKSNIYRTILWVVVLAAVISLGLYVRSYRFQVNPGAGQVVSPAPPPTKTTPLDDSAKPSVHITDIKADMVEDPSLKARGLRLIVCGVARELKGELCKLVFWTDKGIVGDAGYVLPEHKGETFETIVFIPERDFPAAIEAVQLQIYRVSDEKMLLSMQLAKPQTDRESYDDDENQ
jgi:hypothetical protein